MTRVKWELERPDKFVAFYLGMELIVYKESSGWFWRIEKAGETKSRGFKETEHSAKTKCKMMANLMSSEVKEPSEIVKLNEAIVVAAGEMSIMMLAIRKLGSLERSEQVFKACALSLNKLVKEPNDNKTS